MTHRVLAIACGILLLLLAATKFVAPAVTGSLGAWARVAMLVEIVIAVLLLVPWLSVAGARALLCMCLIYTIALLALAWQRIPISSCGCLGSHIRLGFGVHLAILGGLGCLALWCVRAAPTRS